MLEASGNEPSSYELKKISLEGEIKTFPVISSKIQFTDQFEKVATGAIGRQCMAKSFSTWQYDVLAVRAYTVL
jgi:hypothetical protein